MSIPLPPLPDYVRLAAALGPIAANQLCVTKWKDGIDIEVPCGDVDQMFRARDQEIVRCVLEDALRAIDKQCFSHVDGRDLFAQMHPRNTLDIKRRVDARETWFEGDWLTDLWTAIKAARAAQGEKP